MQRSRMMASFVLLLSITPPAAGQEPPPLTAALKMGSASAAPGAEVAIPVLVNGSGPVQGLSFSIDFDETILEVASVEPLWQNGTTWLNEIFPDGSIRWINVRTTDDIPGDSGIAEGYVAGGIVFDSKFKNSFPPPGDDHEIFAIHFLVKPTAPPGATEVRFINDAKPFPNNPAIPNVVTIQGQSVYDLEYVTAPLLINSRLRIIGDITMFIRGDSNDDSAVEMSDAVFTLEFLFLGGPAPRCPDAADANDDGLLDITDPVKTLTFLFLDGSRPPAPFDFQGGDPTEDTLPCGMGS